jgi:hypothetical protein
MAKVSVRDGSLGVSVSTRPCAHAGFDPVWNEYTEMPVAKDDVSAGRHAQISIHDAYALELVLLDLRECRGTSQLLTAFSVPLAFLHPHHQYYLELVDDSTAPRSSPARLYLSVTLKVRAVPAQLRYLIPLAASCQPLLFLCFS